MRAEAGLTEGSGRLRGRVAARCGGVLTGGRVDDDSGYLLELGG
jgi:hypothetical protein